MTKTLSIAGTIAAIAVVALSLFISIQPVSAASTLFGDAEIVSSGGNPGGALQIRSDATIAPYYGGASFDDADGVLFSALATLSTDYNVTDDDCGGGGPRFQIKVDEDNNNVEDASDGSIWVYLGPSPSFTDCAPGWQSSGNLIGNNDAGRWSSENIPGGVNSGTYAQALAAASGMKIWNISIVTDSSWSAAATNGDGEQTVLIDNLTINSTVYDFTPPPVTVTIHKYVGNAHADTTTGENLSFPMLSSWSNAGFPDGTNASYSLAPATYDAETSSMSSGANYATNEDTSGPNVGATCADGKPFALVGYTTGDTEVEAMGATPSATAPALTNITSDKHVIVWNKDCTQVHVTIVKYVDEEHATEANAASNTFTMQATYDFQNDQFPNGIAGTDPYDIGPTGNNTPTPYEAQTLEFYPGADYSTYERTDNAVVGESCADNKPFALNGYSSGDSLEDAQSAATSSVAPAFTDLQSNQYVIVHNKKCVAPPAADVTVTIVKYIGGVHATAGNANSASFPMVSSWDDTNNGGVGNGAYPLSTVGFNTALAYEAVTTDMANGSDYSTNEVTNTGVVGDNCANNQQFRLGGYSTGDSLALAQVATMSSSSPAFTDITTNKYVIVWNEPCPTVPPPNPNPTNACSTPTVAPAGYTLQNGTSGNNTVTIAPNTMYVGNGGNDKVTGPNGNYIVCTGSGNDQITLGNGDSTVDAGGGNNTVKTGDGNGTVVTAGGNDKITVGSGTHTISAGEGNNTVTTGNGDKNVTTGTGNDTITTGNGNDTIDAGGGNNKVNSGAGNDSVTTGSGNDKIDAGADSDTCSAGGGINTVINCTP